MTLFHRNNKTVQDIAPDEIFLDARNLPQFNRDQFEGKIEKPISRRALFLFCASLLVLITIVVGRVFYLQIVRGTMYAQHAQDNVLDKSIIFSQRGVILDRNGELLAWNESQLGDATSTDTEEKSDFPLRRYDPDPSLSHVLGYVRYPQKDRNGEYFQNAIVGVEGVELMYDRELSGAQGHMIVEKDALGNVVSQSTVDAPVDGAPLSLTIDARLQKALYGYTEDLMQNVGFSGGATVVIDVTTGELLVSMSIPGYDPNVLADATDGDAIAAYTNNPHTPFLNRAVGGLYTPGSIVKPFLAIGALMEGIISPEKQIYSDGTLRVPNPYDPAHPTIFKDWKAHGWVDMRRAIAVSSNVYFMTIGGGFGDQKGLGIQNIEKYTKMFGIGQEAGVDIPGEIAGVIPSIAWKQEQFPDDPWRLGDTYNSSIGQYGFQTTPLQMARAIALIANGGILITPHVHADRTNIATGKLPIRDDAFEIVREGMRQGAIDGTAKALNVSYTHFAGKTGTAELGVSKEKVNSWVMGFWPYEHPRYAFAMVMEKGPVTNLIGSASVMRRFFDWMYQNTPEYFADEASS